MNLVTINENNTILLQIIHKKAVAPQKKIAYNIAKYFGTEQSAKRTSQNEWRCALSVGQ